MRKHAALVVLGTLEGLALALLAVFWFVMRPDLQASYGLDRLGVAAAIALSAWFAPGVAGVGGLLVLAALVLRARTRTRTYLAGSGLVWTVFGLTFAVWAAYAPAFERLGR